MDRPKFVYTVYIRTTPEKLWQGLIDPEFTEKYWSGVKLVSDWRVGSKVQMTDAEGAPADSGTVLKFEPPRLLSFTWHVGWHPEMGKEPPSRATFEIAPAQQKGVVRLTITHDEFEFGSKTYEGVSNGWPVVLSNLKSLLETGEPLDTNKFTIRETLTKLVK